MKNHDEGQLFSAFDEAGIELEEAHPASRSIGILAFPGAPNPVHKLELEDVAASRKKAAAAAASGESPQDKVIAKLITRWENLKPQEMLDRFREFALDPYIALGEWMVKINEKTIRSWVKGRRLDILLKKRPHIDSRRVEVQELRIVYIGRNKACATYHLVETYKDNPMTFSGNGAVFLVHLAEGWKIAAYTKASEVGI